MSEQLPEEADKMLEQQKEDAEPNPTTFSSMKKLLRTRSGMIGLAAVLLMVGALAYTSAQMMHYREVSRIFYGEAVGEMVEHANGIVGLLEWGPDDVSSKGLKESYKAWQLQEIDHLQLELRDAYAHLYSILAQSEDSSLFDPEHLVRFDPYGHYHPVTSGNNPYTAEDNAMISPDDWHRAALEELYAVSLDIRVLAMENGYETTNQPRSERDLKIFLNRLSERNAQNLDDPRFRIIE